MSRPMIFYTALAFMILPANAYAYLDPGTGSFILQIALAGFFSASFFARTFWKKIGTLFANRFRRTSSKEDDA